MIRLGLVGHPVAHSLSPVMHRAALASVHLSGDYVAMDVPPGQLESAVSRCRDAGFLGLNVTVPHKEEALGLCAELETSARRIGAVNTLTFAPSGIVGANTDVGGATGSLETHLGLTLSTERALLIGAGGSARAVAAGLLDAGATVMVTNRRAARAESLADELGATALPLEPAALSAAAPTLVVNCTPLGMKAALASPPYRHARAFFAALPWESWARPAVFDLIYAPSLTPMLAEASARGCAVLNGLDMLARQGALAFQRWTEVPASRVLPTMLSALAP